MNMLTPVLCLVVWTLIITCWLAYTRLSEIFAALKKGVRPPKRTQELTGLSLKAVWASDNNSHLHEQPVLFYALCVYSYLVGVSNTLGISLAFLYVGLRVVHSIIQCTKNNLLWRFRTFLVSSAVLIALALINVWALASSYI